MDLSLRRPVQRISAEDGDLHRQAERLRAVGPLVPVELPGGLAAWVVTSDVLGRELLVDRRFVKDVNTWHAWRRGEVPADWPLRPVVDTPRSLITVDGAEHRRLRAPLARALTPARVAALRGPVGAIVAGRLDALAAAARLSPDGTVDYRVLFAFPVPMEVLGLLLGIPAQWYGRLRVLFDDFFSEAVDVERKLAAVLGIRGLIAELIARRRSEPGDDLVGALLTAVADDPYTDEELIGTLLVLIGAGHETTVHLLVHGLRALLRHPEQRALLAARPGLWPAAVEELLRYDAPVATFFARYAAADVRIGDADVRVGDPLLLNYLAMGRDPGRYGDDAGAFDAARCPVGGHTSFGYGPHACPGAQLARLEAVSALPALFARFPGIRLAVPDDELERFPSLMLNGRVAVPVRLDGH
ncbi:MULTISPECIES: cytochrome P450 [Kitasatospora]|uniref:Putative cytochrome P450 n=1 Tax=Kitasatospora setae (strain ATCC 33774 / DSM 43861 / JCM 3304 / KCC A-0304 / NBRC 14216 / KM-6054) TaxID=452652 RepID=E4N5Y5_KITSK|nr:cytochrome P450 [Kitasatospora setae]BAJ26616.1 putative cytochrome P450 [Kitasatospora setae KM-6054]